MGKGIRRVKNYNDVLEMLSNIKVGDKKNSDAENDFSELNDIVNILSQKTRSLERMLDTMSESSKKAKDAIKILNNEEVIPF